MTRPTVETVITVAISRPGRDMESPSGRGIQTSTVWLNITKAVGIAVSTAQVRPLRPAKAAMPHSRHSPPPASPAREVVFPCRGPTCRIAKPSPTNAAPNTINTIAIFLLICCGRTRLRMGLASAARWKLNGFGSPPKVSQPPFSLSGEITNLCEPEIRLRENHNSDATISRVSLH